MTTCAPTTYAELLRAQTDVSSAIAHAGNLHFYQSDVDFGWIGGAPWEVSVIDSDAAWQAHLTDDGCLMFLGSAFFVPSLLSYTCTGIRAVQVAGDLSACNMLDAGTACDIECGGTIHVSPNMLRCRNLSARHIECPDVVSVYGNLRCDTIRCGLLHVRGKLDVAGDVVCRRIIRGTNGAA